MPCVCIDSRHSTPYSVLCCSKQLEESYSRSEFRTVGMFGPACFCPAQTFPALMRMKCEEVVVMCVCMQAAAVQCLALSCAKLLSGYQSNVHKHCKHGPN